jgi:general secretion pathway protein F
VPVFNYKAVTSAGVAKRGHLDADTVRIARAKLRGDGLFLTELVETKAKASIEATSGRSFTLPVFQRISPLDLAVATRQISTLIGAGVPLVEGLAALTEQVENPRLKSVLGEVRNSVNQGTAFADALGATGAFSDLYVGMVRAGEAGGALEIVLARLADYLEGQVRLRNRVGSILIYPLVMFGFALVVIAALVTVVLPQITELLASLNQELPFYTRWIIGASNFARSWWWAMALAAGAAGVGLRVGIRTERGRVTWDRFLLHLPVLGRVVRLLAITRFTRTLSTLLAGGLPIVRALDTAKEVAANVVIGSAIDAARESITEGASVAKPLRESGEFPPLVTHMIGIGEQSGQLEAMLAKIADMYEEQVETTVTRLTALLEPFLILIMVGIVVVIILATLVPLLQVTSSIG